MKILYISNGSNFTSAGGMEYHLIDITNWMNKKGVKTALAVRRGTVLERELLAGRPSVYRLDWTGFNKIRSFVQLAKAIRDYAPDVISINRERDIIRVLLITAVLRPFLRKRPKIVSVFHNDGWKGASVLPLLDGLIFPNEYMRQVYVPGPGRAADRSIVIHHGIHLFDVDRDEKLRPDRERKYFKDARFPLIGMVGELRKNQTELLDVAYQLKQRVPSFTLAIVGRGKDDEIAALREKAERLGISQNVVCTGGVDRKYIPDIFYDLDVSVTTNRREPFGLVFIESLASYTPVVAYDSGGPVEIVEKGGGILVSGGPEGMAEALAKLLSDPVRMKSLALAAREAAEQNFSIDAMGQRHYRFYSDVLNGEPGEGGEK
jgi:glycosyltransferase involved in cell wall biosynthesis